MPSWVGRPLPDSVFHHVPRESAGLLPYRRRGGELEVLLVHLGGPFWAKRDLGAWTIAKGEFAPDEDPLNAAIREFGEETGCTRTGDFQRLTTIKQKAGKVVHAWAVEMDWDTALLTSNTFEMEWPRGSGRRAEQCPDDLQRRHG